MKDLGLKVAIILALVATATGVYYVVTRGVPEEVQNQKTQQNLMDSNPTYDTNEEVGAKTEVENNSEATDIDTELGKLDADIEAAFEMDDDPDPSLEF